jgi:hypothetical protein
MHTGARLNPQNTDAFQANFPGPIVSNMILDPQGDWIIGGFFLQTGTRFAPGIARLLSTTGETDWSFTVPHGNNGLIRSMARSSKGDVWVAGSFSTIGGVARSGVARLKTGFDLPRLNVMGRMTQGTFDEGLGARFQLTGDRRGNFSAILQGKFTRRFRGSFSSDGTWSGKINDENGQARPLNLELIVDALTGEITLNGTLTQAPNNSLITANQPFGTSPIAVGSALAGYSTGNLFPSSSDLEEPNGGSLVAMNVNRRGIARLRGVLADGTSWTAASGIGSNGDLSFHRMLYGTRGSLACSCALTDDISGIALAGIFEWVKKAGVSTTNYPQGFDVTDGALLVRYQPAVPFLNGLSPSPNNVFLTLNDGNLPLRIDGLITFDPFGKLTDVGSFSGLTLKLNKGTGLFTGSIPNPLPGLTGKVSFRSYVVTGRSEYFGFMLLRSPLTGQVRSSAVYFGEP